MNYELKSLILSKQNLRQAIGLFKQMLDGSGTVLNYRWASALLQRVEEVEADYLLMRNFMRQGYDDAQRDELYRRGLRKLYGIYVDFVIEEETARKAELKDATSRLKGWCLQWDDVRKMMEGFVQDVAMASLSVDGKQDERLDALRKSHADDMALAFDAVLTSRGWDAAMTEQAVSVLLSPAVETADAALLVSALMLAQGICFDYGKWKTLVDIYRKSDDEGIRQRAFVGLMLTLPTQDMVSLFPEIDADLQELFCNDEVKREALELQMQMVYCMNADADTEEIRRDIMPNLMKHSDFRVTKDGIEEVEDDALQDILNPGAADKAMEEVENAVRQMSEMQQRGADIYFGGFSQMKRFPFFYKLCNWFMPFHDEHPDLKNIKMKLGESVFLKLLFERGPFCDSDKYSFALAMSQVIDRIPPNMREMLDNEEALGPLEEAPEVKTAAYARRMYLQDLYRFFRLYRNKQDFRNPFERDETNNPRLLLANPVLAGLGLDNQLAELEKFYYKRKRYAEIIEIEERGEKGEERVSRERRVLYASALLKLNRFTEARHVFAMLLAEDDANQSARRGLAQAAFYVKDYTTADREYSRLIEEGSVSMRSQLFLAIAKLHLGKMEEGMQLIYKLDIEQPDNLYVRRTLAWGLLMQGKCEQAESIYSKILQGSDVQVDDYLNAGYSKWFTKKMDEAVDCFRKCIKNSRQETDNDDEFLVKRFAEDDNLLNARGISLTEQKLMRDLVVSERAKP